MNNVQLKPAQEVARITPSLLTFRGLFQMHVKEFV